MTINAWNPEEYQKFELERIAPFYDLLSLIQPVDNMRIVDLGCGTGALTRQLHDALKATSTLGIDSSQEMLDQSVHFANKDLIFQKMNIEDFNPTEQFDLIFSNAALQWVPNHGKIIPKLCKFLTKNGQIAIQIPANFDYPTHTIANELADELPFSQDIAGGIKSSVLTIEEYSNLLYRIGFTKQIVRAQVYAHLLDSTDSLVEWVKGSLLTYFKSRLPNDLYADFLKAYRKRLLDTLGWSSPFLFPMKRILIWAQKE